MTCTMRESLKAARSSKNSLVYITPNKFTHGRKGFHDRMPGLLEMFCRVFVFRAITTPNVPARKTQPQTYPDVTGLSAVFTDRDIFGMHILYLVSVRALWHIRTPVFL